MKQEDKDDRLAVVAIKKKRYGIGKLSKDETKGMRKRTEERILLAKVKENLWRKYQDKESDDDKDRDDQDQTEEDAWESLDELMKGMDEDGRGKDD